MLNNIKNFSDNITKNYTFYEKFKFENNQTFVIKETISYENNLKIKEIIINNETFSKLKENGEFLLKNNKIIYYYTDNITKNYIYYEKFKYEKNEIFTIKQTILYNDHVKTKEIIIDNEEYKKLKENGEFLLKN